MSVVVIDGRVRCIWMTACNNPSAPTVAECNAGTDITTYINPDGLNISMATGKVPNGNVGSVITTNLAGRQEPGITITGHHDATAGSTDPLWNLATYRAFGFFLVRSGIDKATAFAVGQGGGGANGAVECYPIQAGQYNHEKFDPNSTWDFTIDLFVYSDAMSKRAVIS
jgi:hypothetical protein